MITTSVRPATGVRLASDSADFARLGLNPLRAEVFEDGLRTDPNRRGSYEWWYFDANLDNGAKLVVGFYTKNPATPNTRLAPFVTINLDLPDGRSFEKTFAADATQFSASAEGCDVRIGENRFSGDLQTYRVAASIENVTVTVTLAGTVPAWRPATGYEMFARNGVEKTFAWFVAVPNGRVEAEYSVDGQVERATGIGYHDHNWGDAPMRELMHNWYWGRAQVGPYSLIAAHITAEKAYGYEPLTILHLARDGVVVADDGTKVAVSTDRIGIDVSTGKPVADALTYDYRAGPDRFTITFEREQTLLRTRFIDVVPPAAKVLARLMRFDAAYLRFAGTLVLRRYLDDVLVEEHTETKALWELMYLGRTRALES
ncbi:MAG: hydroxyneurosporene dehydrogenase [Cryobacterium sp.]|uniref:lipocalin-like domain-containing protein n=1 Tax=Cryobacterium sp. TaxID=1926290 RepID=UPI0022A50D4B|nr:lipocalin-like domain-containing protein [Cryobacterium sp.]MCY7403666.1 hydroxyneurosporene dehydrogenase [Cryobacterium sp.]